MDDSPIEPDIVNEPAKDVFDFEIPNNLQAMAELKNILTQCT
jgi:hypothetical protein